MHLTQDNFNNLISSFNLPGKDKNALYNLKAKGISNGVKNPLLNSYNGKKQLKWYSKERESISSLSNNNSMMNTMYGNNPKFQNTSDDMLSSLLKTKGKISYSPITNKIKKLNTNLPSLNTRTDVSGTTEFYFYLEVQIRRRKPHTILLSKIVL